MPNIYVQWLKGRTDETRERVARAFTEALTSIEGTHIKDPEHVVVTFMEAEPGQDFVGGEATRPAWLKERM